jgi:hypothetical protein
MNRIHKQLKARFGPAVEFEVPSVPVRAALTSELEELKNRLLHEALQKTTVNGIDVALRRAANDAAALVWLTPYPLLLLPELLAEKTRAARERVGRQRQIRRKSEILLVQAV